MGICPDQLRNYVIKTTLKQLGEWSPAAEQLLLGTAAQESGLGFHLKSGRKQGLGIYQITPRTHINIWDRYLVHLPDLASGIRGLASQHEFLAHPHAELATNLSYATAIAWMIYRRCNKPLPQDGCIEDIARYWARHFHTKPNGTAQDFIISYHKFMDGTLDNNGLAA